MHSYAFCSSSHGHPSCFCWFWFCHLKVVLGCPSFFRIPHALKHVPISQLSQSLEVNKYNARYARSGLTPMVAMMIFIMSMYIWGPMLYRWYTPYLIHPVSPTSSFAKPLSQCLCPGHERLLFGCPSLWRWHSVQRWQTATKCHWKDQMEPDSDMGKCHCPKSITWLWNHESCILDWSTDLLSRTNYILCTIHVLRLDSLAATGPGHGTSFRFSQPT